MAISVTVMVVTGRREMMTIVVRMMGRSVVAIQIAVSVVTVMTVERDVAVTLTVPVTMRMVTAAVMTLSVSMILTGRVGGTVHTVRCMAASLDISWGPVHHATGALILHHPGHQRI
jgi:hypothetical protein